MVIDDGEQFSSLIGKEWDMMACVGGLTLVVLGFPIQADGRSDECRGRMGDRNQ